MGCGTWWLISPFLTVTVYEPKNIFLHNLLAQGTSCYEGQGCVWFINIFSVYISKTVLHLVVFADSIPVWFSNQSVLSGPASRWHFHAVNRRKEGKEAEEEEGVEEEKKEEGEEELREEQSTSKSLLECVKDNDVANLTRQVSHFWLMVHKWRDGWLR